MLVNTTGEHYNMTGLISGATYRITVAAINSVGLGGESEALLLTATQSATTKTPTGFGRGTPRACPVTSHVYLSRADTMS